MFFSYSSVAELLDHARRGCSTLGVILFSIASASCTHPSIYELHDTIASTDVLTDSSSLAPSHILEIPLTIHYATIDGKPVLNTNSVRESLDRANLALADFGIFVYVAEQKQLPNGLAQILDSDDRLMLADRADSNGSVHVFFVDRVALFSPRHGDSRVSGMHWRYHGLHHKFRQREYLVVARDAPNTTLVHEIGHAFGLGHDRSEQNLMCSCRRGDAPSFTRRQGAKMRNGARRFLQRNY